MRYKRKIFGTSERPRLSVFRSNKHIYVQVIDDIKKHTLAAANSLQSDKKNKTKRELASEVGELLARRAKKINVKKVVFDRGKFKFHGRVRQLAEQARKGGLDF